MTKQFVLFFLLFVSLSARSQQLPLFTQYRDNNGVINPASVNSNFFTNDENATFGASYRKQWLGLSGSPTTQTLRGEYLTTNPSGVNMLWGGHIMNDQTGPTGFAGLYARGSAVISNDVTERGWVIGMSLGVVQYRVDVTKLRLHDEGDIAASDDQRKIFPDAGLGVYYYQQLRSGNDRNDFVFGGLSVPQLFGLNLEFKNPDGTFSTRRVQHLFGNVGFIHFLSESSFLESTLWAKYAPNAPFNTDLNVRLQMNPTFWIGIGGSTASMIHAETGVLLGEKLGINGNIRIGYGFDYSFSTFGPFAGGTHELNVSYSFGSER